MIFSAPNTFGRNTYTVQSGWQGLLGIDGGKGALWEVANVTMDSTRSR